MSSSAAVPAEPAQQNNFNPSWMRSAFHGSGAPAPTSVRALNNEEEDYPVSAPVFVKNRYGREDLLALVGQEAHPPDGLSGCPFFLTNPANPIVCYPLTDLEQRLQQNVNSSKAMSSLTQAERASVAAGGVYGSPNGVGSPSAPSRGGAGGGWTPVKANNSWSRSNAASTASGGAVARGASRPYVARGAARPSVESPGQTEDGSTTPFGQRFVKAGGRGTPTTARGGSTTANSFNSRAQGLYDPRDPKDRPRNRLRSTSDEGAEPTTGNGTDSAGWTTVTKPAWTGKGEPASAGAAAQNWNRDKESAWNGLSRENSGTSASGAAWKAENSGPLPEWMDDGDKEEVAIESNRLPGTGSFDDQGHYGQAKITEMMEQASKERSAPPPASVANPWVQGDHPNRNPQGPQLGAEASSVYASALSSMNAYGGVPMNHSVPVMPRAAPVVPVIPRPPPTFFYLDPTKQERGPFEKDQMDAWFKTGYFNDQLEVRRKSDSVWKSLGELKRINGAITPFDYKDEAPLPVPVQQMYPQSSFGTIFGGGGNVWNDTTSNPMNAMYGQHPHTQVFDQMTMERKRIDEEQRRMIDEQLQKRDQEMMQKLKEAEEHAKAIRERERALEQKEEEIERRLNEERSIREMEQMHLAEKVRMLEAEKQARLQEEQARDREEAKKVEEARKISMKKKEEEERRRAEIEMELQRRKQEEERKKRAEEAAEEHKRKLIQQAEEDAAKIKQQALQEAAKKDEERKRAAAAKKASETFEIQEAWQAAPKPTFVDFPTGPDDGWNTPGVPKKKTPAAPKAAPWSAVGSTPREKTLKEIQEEEERQQRAEMKQQARIKKEDSATNLQSSGTWSNASQRISWNQPAPVASVGKSVWGASSGSDSRKPVTMSPLLDGPSLQSSNRPSAPAKKAAPVKAAAAAKPAAKPTAKPAAKQAPKSWNDKTEVDPFTSWVVQRLKQLSSTVDADVLASFLESVENPNEVEDYVEGYLGSSKSSKEFVKEFLHKRCEMKKRGAIAKDDLSSAKVAPVAGTVTGSGQGKKKKSKGTRLVVDGSCLGFRPAADSNRLNQGEIETVPLASGQKR